MIEKQDFYHGAVLSSLLDEKRFCTITKKQNFYILNGTIAIYIKYSTKSRTPWSFVFKDYELKNIKQLLSDKLNFFIVCVCGGDGICTITYKEFINLLEDTIGSISVNRKFNKSYSISGTKAMLNNKISRNRWPNFIFEKQ